MKREPLDYGQQEKTKPLRPVEWLVVCVVAAMVLCLIAGLTVMTISLSVDP